MQGETQEPVTPNPKKRRSPLFWLGRAIIYVLLFVTSILVLVHLPPVQRWGIQRITKSMRTTLDTDVRIESFTLNPISDLTLNNIYIGSPGRHNDTMIYALHLGVDYYHLWDLLDHTFTINQISIERGTLNIHKLATDSLNNLDIALLKMMPSRDTTKPSFVLNLHQINAVDLNVYLDDESTGALMRFDLHRADVAIDTFDITGHYIDIKSLDLDNPRIAVFKRVIAIDSNRLLLPKSNVWDIDVNQLELTDGVVSIENLYKPRAVFADPIGLDFSHLLLSDLDLQLDSMALRGSDFSAQHIQAHILAANGFEINKLAADKALITEQGIRLDQFQLETDQTNINNTIALEFSGFSDFSSFADSVTISIPDAKVNLHMHDLLAIAPGLQSVDFFSQNANKTISLYGNLNGYINKLKILNMNASMGGVKLVGDFRSRDLAVKNQQLISLDLSSSTFSANSLKSIFPGMKIPPELSRVGTVNFTGKYDGYPNDFVAFGTFNTALGRVTLDMKLNTVNGIALGKYSGIVGFQNFDLGTLTGIKDLGRITMSGRVIDGTGLTTSSISADITGQLDMLEYKGYTYQDARIDGQITGKLFNGTLDINDPNVDMHFEGIADFRDSVPKLDFVAKVDGIRFSEIGFSKEPVFVSGYIDADLTAGNWSQLNGTLKAEHIRVMAKGQEYDLDSLYLIADVDTVTQDRYYKIESDIVSGVIRGIFNPLTLANQMQQYLYEKYPNAIDPPAKLMAAKGTQRLTWDLDIHDTKHWLSFSGLEGLEIKNGKTTGSLDMSQHLTTGTIDLPELHYNGVNVYGSTMSFKEENGTTDVDLEVIAADLKENFFFEDVLLQGTATDDSIKVRFKTDDLADIIDEIDMDIVADPNAGSWTLSFSPRKLKMLDSDWQMPQGNRLEIRDKYFDAENFELVSTNQHIRIEDIDHKGIKADIAGFDMSYLNDLWVNDKFKFAGQYNLIAEVDNIYDIKKLHSTLTIPDLKINNVPYGEWIMNASMENPKDSVRIDLVMHNDETKLTAQGAYLPPIKSIPKEDQNYIRLNIETTDFPLDFLEFLLGGNIRDTEGSVDMTMTLSGKGNKLVPNGIGKVYNGSTTIDYLGASYSFHDQAFSITPDMIDLTGAKLYDVIGNVATIRGGLTHKYLRNLGLNATITSDKITGLDVTSEENNVFYGTGIGEVHASFTGPIANAKMDIQMITAKGTHIYIPLSGSASASDKDFAIFLENGVVPSNRITPINLGGIELNINMTITDDAIVELIFDDNTGEVMRGTGSGNLSMSMTRTGNFSMRGKYTISDGDYLFTSFKFVRKPFEILNGSSIQWTGDPYDAILNVRAKYKGLTAPVYPFIQEYLTGASNDIIQQARQRTPVDLTMILTGSLIHPDIAFDLDFPLLTGELKGITDTKINVLKSNENAMSQQVVGLLITRSFLPTIAVNSQALSAGLESTVSEFISSTFSGYLGGLLGDLIPQGKFLTGIDFQVAVDLPVGNIVGDNPGEANEAEVEINLPLEFFNDRLTINLGGNYIKGAIVGVSEYFAGDVLFEYSITPDRRLKIRAYNRNTLTVEGPKNKIGVGVSYKREYNSFPEIFGKKKKATEPVIRDSTTIVIDNPIEK